MMGFWQRHYESCEKASAEFTHKYGRMGTREMFYRTLGMVVGLGFVLGGGICLVLEHWTPGFAVLAAGFAWEVRLDVYLVKRQLTEIQKRIEEMEGDGDMHP